MTAALIIAAGHTNTTKWFQPLLQVGGITAVERLITVFYQAGVERVVLVGNAADSELERRIAHMGTVFLPNSKENPEMLDSVKTGLAYLAGKCSRVLITPVDVPLFSLETVEALLACTEKLAVPSHQNKSGHPLLLSAGLFEAVLHYEGNEGLAGAIRECGREKAFVSVPDAGVLLDIQKHTNYQHLVEQHSLRQLRPEVKLYLAKEKVFFGPGPFLLLCLIDETESLATACRHMGISYSKGWKMIENIEHQLERELVIRRRGGREKGKSELTPEARELLSSYAAFQKESQVQVLALFEKYFPKKKK